MHATFLSLYLKMRKLKSNIWLFLTVIASSCFGFLFALITTYKLGVPVNVRLLSEGLPFLVVTIGFEKPIVLTHAVLQAATTGRPTAVGNAVNEAVRQKGALIIRDYLIEIAILIIGVFSGVQGGLRQFCFLAAWILVYDCLLLFTFYTAILSIKLEITRIKRHVALRKALEEDGLSRRAAENVAKDNEPPTMKISKYSNILMGGGSEGGVSRFKWWMVIGFLAINFFNLWRMPFGGTAIQPLKAFGIASSFDEVNVWNVAGPALEHLKITMDEGTVLTVLQSLEYTMVGKASAPPPVAIVSPFLESPIASIGGEEVHIDDLGAQIEGFLKSLENPMLSKWLVFALAISIIFNAYLFNAARWSINAPPTQGGANQPKVVERIVRVNCTCGGAPEEEDSEEEDEKIPSELPPGRTIEDLRSLVAQKRGNELTDVEAVELALRGFLPLYSLEITLGNKFRAVKVRRAIVSRNPASAHLGSKLENSALPYKNYDYERIWKACCENVVGYLPLPLGIAGPLMIDGKLYNIPMATTEGVLVASTSRGSKAINMGGGASTVLVADGMTRGPCISFPTMREAGAAKLWLDSDEGFRIVKEAFESTSRFAKLQTVKPCLAGNLLFIRFRTTTGDAMGMNMISKGVDQALKAMMDISGFENMRVQTLSGNYCTDKKPAAINWIDGRGKGVVAEAIIPAKVIAQIFKTTPDALVELNITKNLIGSAMAGSVGGFNAHAANLVAAIFLATGQDPAQVVESANCITIMRTV